MSLFSFFYKKQATVNNLPLSFLNTDMHAHFLPGIDDGAKTMDESLWLIKKMKDLGYQKLIATPHVNLDFYPNAHSTILNVLNKVKEALLKNDINIEIDAAAEYMIDEGLMAKLSAGEPLLTIHNNFVLTEMGYIQESPILYDALFSLQSSGYQPILAHPERYSYYFQHPLRKISDLKDKGFLFQLNILSILGYYGKEVEKMANILLKNNFYDYCGTDIHHRNHVLTIQKLLNSKNIKKLHLIEFENPSL